MENEMNLEKYEGLIFDLDGTLIQSMESHCEAWIQTCRKHHIPLDAEWFNERGGIPSRKISKEIVEMFDLNASAEEITLDKVSIYERIAKPAELNSEIYNILKTLHKTKKTAIGTGGQAKHAYANLQANDILSMIDAIVTSEDVTNHKPYPDTFLVAAEKIGVDPKKCVVFEDTMIGKQAAHAAGMDCYLVTNGKISNFFPV